jgi:hypothetical protein
METPEFKEAFDKENLIKIKSNLGVIRLTLEEKLKKEEQSLIEFQQRLPQLIHKERISRIKKEG